MKYIKAKRITTATTTLSLRPIDKEALICYESGDDEFYGVDVTDVEAFLAVQDPAVEAVEVSYGDIEPVLKASRLLRDINDITKARIAERYSIADEIKMLKLSETDSERVIYQTYVDACRGEGRTKKRELGLVI